VNDSLISKPIEASEMAQLVNLYTNELISRRTVLEELQRGGVIDPDLVVDDEIERIEEEKTEKEEHDAELAEEKLGQDLHRAEEFQAVAPSEPGQGTEEKPKEEKPKKEKSEQDKTAQAAKVAK
jgi:hypothetical protein